MGIIFLFIKMAKKAQVADKDKGKGASKSAQGAKKTGGKAKKKSWTKVKVKDKLNNEVYLDQRRYDKLCTEIPKILCVTRAILCEKFKVNGSVARALIRDLTNKGLLEPRGQQFANFSLLRGVQSKSAAEKLADEQAAADAKKKKADK